MKLIIGLLLGFLLATSASIAQEWLDVDSGISPMNPQVLIPMPPLYSVPPIYSAPYSLPPMPVPQWEHISPC